MFIFQFSKLEWKHEELSMEIDIRQERSREALAHKIREGWRNREWNRFRYGDRREVTEIRSTKYDSRRIPKVREHLGQPERVAIMLGAFKSPGLISKTIGNTYDATFICYIVS